MGGIRKIMVLWQVVFLAASPLVTAPPSNLTRLYYNGSSTKSHSTTTQYRQLRSDYITTAPPPNLTRLLHNTASYAGYTNPVKAFNGMCVRLITSITFPVMWSSVLISVTREWRYCGLVYKFFLINNKELKCSFVRCRKYHKS